MYEGRELKWCREITTDKPVNSSYQGRVVRSSVSSNPGLFLYEFQEWPLCGYSRLSCYGNYIWICANRPTGNSTFRQVTEPTDPETTTWSSTSRYFSKIYKRTNPRIEKIQIVLTSLCWQQRIIYTLWRTTYFYRQRLGIKKQTALLCERLSPYSNYM